MAQAPPERASDDGNKARSAASGLRGRGEPYPLTDGHLLALLGGAAPDLRDAISILALSGMRLAELRRLRVAHEQHKEREAEARGERRHVQRIVRATPAGTGNRVDSDQFRAFLDRAGLQASKFGLGTPGFALGGLKKSAATTR